MDFRNFYPQIMTCSQYGHIPISLLYRLGHLEAFIFNHFRLYSELMDMVS